MRAAARRMLYGARSAAVYVRVCAALCALRVWPQPGACPSKSARVAGSATRHTAHSTARHSTAWTNTVCCHTPAAIKGALLSTHSTQLDACLCHRMRPGPLTIAWAEGAAAPSARVGWRVRAQAVVHGCLFHCANSETVRSDAPVGILPLPARDTWRLARCGPFHCHHTTTTLTAAARPAYFHTGSHRRAR